MIKQYLSLFISTILWACATVQGPTGGEKDVVPPKLYESNPKNQSTEFKGKEIRLYFTEWMKVDNLKKELIITPREEIEYDFNLKKQELIITLEKPLRDSTTYTLNFRKSLKDITEGNLWENPILAFSTGNYLDSLHVKGKIQQITNEKPAKNFIVGLYDAKYDSANLRQGKPTYFTTTDEEGKFLIQNIKTGKYRLYAFLDKNDNLINESNTEAFAYFPGVLDLKDSLEDLKLNSYQRNEDTLKLKKSGAVGKDFIVQYNKGIKHYRLVNPIDTNQYIFANNIEQGKYLRVYQENFPDINYEKDSIQLFISVTDSIQTTRTDSVYFKVRESRITNETIAITEKPSTAILYGEQQWEIKTNKPIHKINYDSMQIRIDSIPFCSLTAEHIQLSEERKSLIINLNITKEALQTFTDSIQSRNDSIRQTNKNQHSPADSLIHNRTDEPANTNKLDQPANKDTKNMGMNRLDKNMANTSSMNRGSETNKLNLYLGKGVFIGIEQDSTAQTSINFKFKNQEEYGILKGSVIGADFNFIVELLSDKYEVLDTVRNQKDFVFHYVKPGELRLRLIKDDNNNGVWDPGKPLILQAEEQIYYKDELIQVKKDWIVIDKNFDFSVDKEVDNSGN